MLRPIFCLLLFLLMAATAFAQERGIKVTPYNPSANSPLKGDSGARKAALIVGISDYSSKKLQLHYANKDAVLFYDYITGIRRFPKENVFMLADSVATSGKIYNAIIDMMRWLNKGDELVLYFAGHGDVQSVADFDEAFFLAWDASDTRNYHGAAGTLKLSDLELYTNRLASAKKVKVTLIMDACHSGFSLHNDGILKAQDNIVSSFNQVSKMLGCAVNEFSYEADSVGHGLFTWYLVQGMMGLADAPADNKLTLNELGSWVKAKVGGATRGKQNPVVTGPDEEQLVSEVTPDIRSKALAYFGKKQYNQLLAGRGTGGETAFIDTVLQHYVDRYNYFLMREELYGTDSSSLGVIKGLSRINNEKAAELVQGLQSHLAEVLETRSQVVLNEYLKGKSEQPSAQTYYTAGVEAALADSLLVDGDPRKKGDKVMEAFHKAYSYLRYDRFEKFGEAEHLLRQAIAIEDRAAYLYLAMSYLMRYQLKYDSAIYYAKKAETIIPTWSHPKNVLGNLYSDINQEDKALDYHRQVLELDSSYNWSYNNIGVSMLNLGRLMEAEHYFRKSLDMKQRSGVERLNRDWAISYSNLGVIYKERGLMQKAEAYFKVADSIDGSFTMPLKSLSELYEHSDGHKAEDYLHRMIQASPYNADGYSALGQYYYNNTTIVNHLFRADSLNDIAIALNPFDQYPYANKGAIFLDKNKPDSALIWYKKAIEASRGNEWALRNLATFYENTKHYDSAFVYYAQALQKNPYNVEIATEYANTLVEQGDTAMAEKILLRSLSYQHSSPAAYYELGNYYFRIRKWTKAIPAYEGALGADSSYTQALVSLAYVHLLQNKTVQSRQYIRKLQALEARDGRLQEYVSLVLEKSGDIPLPGRYAWLSGFLNLDSLNTGLNEALAEAAYYNSKVPLKAVLNRLTRADNQSETINPQSVKWGLLLAIEVKDGAAMKQFAQRYIDETVLPESHLAAAALEILGYANEARQFKISANAKNWQPLRSEFKKLYLGI